MAGLAPRLSTGSALPARVPFTVKDGAVTVEAALGAGVPFRAVVDIGMADCVVSQTLAKERGLTGVGEVMIAAPLGHLRVAPAGAHTLRFGRTQIEALPLCVADPYAQQSDVPRPDGPALWVGTAALALFALEFDPQSLQLSLESRDLLAPARAGRPIPFTLNEGRAEVRATAGAGNEFRAILSTGTRGTLIPASAARKLKPEPGTERTVKGLGGGTVRIGAVRLKELAIGPAKVADVVAVAVLEGSADQSDDVGVIGTDALLRFRIRVDYGRSQLVLTPVRARKLERPDASERPTGQRPGQGMPRRFPQARAGARMEG
ncbi:MAG: hypothetical protein FJX72_04955 [Armatimonadetes bacterium]|nr:hypothetical protein [Armatimonadota bacterium]